MLPRVTARKVDDYFETQLEYLAVYGRASMTAFRQLSTRNVREARLNTHGQKFDPESVMSLLNLKLCSHIWSTNLILYPPPLHWTFFSPSWSKLSPWVICGGWVDRAGDNFFLSRTET